jgi:hypothetical protein
MSKLTYRIKLFIVIVLFAIFAGIMFTFGYGILESKNTARLDLVNKQNLELEVLKREQKNSEQAKKDLATLDQKPHPPSELFSKDTKVVKEIRTLEDLAARYNLDFTMSISGTSKTAEKAPGVASDLSVVPYTVTVDGAFPNVLNYISATEHTNFVTHTEEIHISSIDNGMVRATIASQFYLKK